MGSKERDYKNVKKTGFYLPEMYMFQKAMVGPGRKKGRVLNHPEMCTHEF